jgi:hypothetical protein
MAQAAATFWPPGAPRGPASRNAAHQEKRDLDKLSYGAVKIPGGELSISWLAVRLSA